MSDTPQHPALTSSSTSLVELASAVLLLWFGLVPVGASLWPPEGQLAVGRAEALICLVGVVGVLLARRAGQRRDLALVAVPLVVLAALVVTKLLYGLQGDWLVVTATGTLATAVAALLTRPPVVAAVGVVVVALLVLAQTGAGADAVSRPWVLVATRAASVVAVAVVAAYGAALLRRSAKSTDALLARADRVAAANRHARDVAAAAAEARRSIHDTALNTLELVARSADDVAIDRLRLRCAQDAAALRPLVFPVEAGAPSDVQALVDLASSRAESVGLAFTSTVSAGTGTPPRPVLAAVTGSVGEAILNASKHSGATSVHLDVVAASDALQVDIIDQGVGFDPADPALGFGVRDSLQARMTDVGGAAWVENNPGGGTRVALRWPAPGGDSAGPGLSLVDLADARRAMASAFILLSVGTGAVALLASWWSLDRPGVALVTTLALGAWALLLLGRLRRHRGLRGLDVLVTLNLLALAVLLSPVADTYCTVAAGPLVPPDARIGLAAGLVLLAPTGWVVAVTALTVAVADAAALLLAHALWPSCGAQQLTETVFSLGVIAMVALFGRALRREGDAADLARQSSFEASARVRAAISIEQDRRRWIRPAVLPALQLLEAISEGRLDPTTGDARDRCARSAVLLRSILALTAVQPLRTVHAELCDAVLAAHHAGAAVEVRGEVAALRPPQGARESLVAAVRALVEDIPEQPIVCFGFADDDRQGVSLVSRTVRTVPPPPVSSGAEWSVETDTDDASVSVSFEWPVKGAARPRALAAGA